MTQRTFFDLPAVARSSTPCAFDGCLEPRRRIQGAKYCELHATMKRGRVTGVDRTFADVVCSLCGEQRLVSVAKKFTICKSCLRGYEGLYRSARQHGATQDQLVAWMRYPHCAICDRRLYVGKGKDGARGYAIDHDHNCCPSSHSCGRCIRGLLCHPCNMSLGGLEAMIERASLDVVLAYLNR